MCALPSCKVEDGGHEILVVNFIAKSKDGETDSSLSAADKIQRLKSGKWTVTGLIIQNSRGVADANGIVGLTVDAQRTKRKTAAGYFVLTSDYLLNLGVDAISDMYVHFVIPADVADQFSSELTSE